MVIDFHTHVFPDNLAEKALGTLLHNINYLYEPYNDTTLSGLIRNMDAWGIDLSVVQPVVTKPSQMKSLNAWAASICSDRILSFGGIYPHTDDYQRDIDDVAELGLKGLKFHPEYQDFVLDDDRMLKIYDYAFSKGLIILMHAGADLSMPGPYKSSPRQFARVVDAMQGGILVAAHFGGHSQWDDVERFLMGKNIYLDTSMGFEYYSSDQFLRIVRGHGSERILFASDSPWSNARTEVEHLRSLPLAEDEKDNILYRNACKLLCLDGKVRQDAFARTS